MAVYQDAANCPQIGHGGPFEPSTYFAYKYTSHNRTYISIMSAARTLSLKVSSQTAAVIELLAEGEGLTVSAWLKAAAREKIERVTVAGALKKLEAKIDKIAEKIDQFEVAEVANE